MRNEKIIPGIILVFIGIIILLDNFGYIDFDWGELWHLWPLFLIIAGVNLLFANNRSPLATGLKIGVILLSFIFVLFAFGNLGYRLGIVHSSNSWFHHNDDNDNDNNNSSDKDDDDDDDDDTAGTKSTVKMEAANFSLPYTADAKVAQLNINGGGTKYILSDTTNQLFKADIKQHFGKYNFSHSTDGGTYVLNFDMKDKNGHNNFNIDIGDDKVNLATFKLNVNPLWDINVDAGATALKFDLTKFKIRTLKLNGGAASFEVKLGLPVAGDSNVAVSTGMAAVKINIPENAACKIITDSGLSSNTFDGFTKKTDGDYETPGYDGAKNKIVINISGGISDFTVNRY